MAKKAPASPLKKAPAKRKPRPKKPPVIKTETGIELSEFSPETLIRLQEILDAKLNPEKIKLHDPTGYGEPVQSKILSALAYALPCLIALVLGIGIGVYAAGGIQIGGNVVPVADAVSEVFDTQEAAFRKLNGELAQKLIAGEVKSENEARKWMESNFLPQSDAAWIKLLESEKAEFGGDKWTAEKQAAVIGRYAR
jgi:hypothetical protein